MGYSVLIDVFSVQEQPAVNTSASPASARKTSELCPMMMSLLHHMSMIYTQIFLPKQKDTPEHCQVSDDLYYCMKSLEYRFFHPDYIILWWTIFLQLVKVLAYDINRILTNRSCFFIQLLHIHHTWTRLKSKQLQPLLYFHI